MMMQIAFSAELADKIVDVAGQNHGTRQFHEIYGEFTPHRCTIDGCCQRAVLRAKRTDGPHPPTIARTDEGTGSESLSWTCSGPHSTADLYCPDRPNLLATYGSYITVSRYGDILLRSCENGQTYDDGNRNHENFAYGAWRKEAWKVLILMSLFLPGLAIPILAARQAVIRWSTARRKSLAEPTIHRRRPLFTRIRTWLLPTP